MTGSTRNSVLHHRAHRRAARAVVGSRLYAYYDALLGKPLPAELKGLVAQLVAQEFRTEKSTDRPVGILQLAAPLPTRQS
jgi:hypothetical protein